MSNPRFPPGVSEKDRLITRPDSAPLPTPLDPNSPEARGFPADPRPTPNDDGGLPDSSDPDDLDRPHLFQRLRDEATDDDGVVDDEYPGPGDGYSPPARPTSPSFSASAAAVMGFVAYSSAPAMRAWKICAGSLSDVTITTRTRS